MPETGEIYDFLMAKSQKSQKSCACKFFSRSSLQRNLRVSQVFFHSLYTYTHIYLFIFLRVKCPKKSNESRIFSCNIKILRLLQRQKCCDFGASLQSFVRVSGWSIKKSQKKNLGLGSIGGVKKIGKNNFESEGRAICFRVLGWPLPPLAVRVSFPNNIMYIIGLSSPVWPSLFDIKHNRGNFAANMPLLAFPPSLLACRRAALQL